MHRIEKRVLQSILKQEIISHDTHQEFQDDRTFGERIADQVALFGGSWTFIVGFGGVLIWWAVLNSYILSSRNEAFDPYPYILLNLFLSMLAAIQAPIIMIVAKSSGSERPPSGDARLRSKSQSRA
jgi:uncharacterized membrane protein